MIAEGTWIAPHHHMTTNCKGFINTNVNDMYVYSQYLQYILGKTNKSDSDQLNLKRIS